MITRAKPQYWRQDLANSDLGYPGYIMNLHTSEPIVLNKDSACCTVLILNY